MSEPSEIETPFYKFFVMSLSYVVLEGFNIAMITVDTAIHTMSVEELADMDLFLSQFYDFLVVNGETNV